MPSAGTDGPSRSRGRFRQRLATMESNVGLDAGGPVIGNNRNHPGAGSARAELIGIETASTRA